MSVLDTFVLMFTTDDTGLEKGSDKAIKSVKKVNEQLSTQQQISKNLSGGIQNLIKQYGALAVGVLSVTSIIKGLKDAASHASTLDMLSYAIDANVESLDAWGRAVRLSGGTAEGFYETTKMLTAEMSKFATTGGSNIAPFFQLLGVRLLDSNNKARDLFKILPELADAFQRVGKGRALELGKSIGLDQGTIMLLQSGSREVDRLILRQKELGVVTKKDAEIASAFNKAWMEMNFAFKGLFTTVGSSVLPALTMVFNGVEKFIGFLKENEHLVKGALIAIGAVILAFVVPPLITAAAAALAVYGPFLLIGLAVAAIGAAFALAYDDIMNFLDGNDSVIGEMLKKWPIIGEIIKGVIKVFQKLWEIMGKVGNFIKSFFGGKTEADINGTLNHELLGTAQQSIAEANESPLNAYTSSSINNLANSNRNSATSVTTGPITINTQATDADGIAGQLRKTFEYELRQAGSSMDDGVLA